MKRANYATQKRSEILKYLELHCDEDVSVKDIEQHFQKDNHTSVNITTIYRYLERLEKEGRILKHNAEKGGKATFQYVKPEHSCQSHLHMKCSSCGKIYHMDCDFMEEFQRHIYEHHHFRLECKTSMLYGLCKACSEEI